MKLRTQKQLFSALIIAGIALVQATVYQSQYEEYFARYKDSHLSSKFSLEAFTANIKTIENHNSKENAHSLGINQFTGVSIDDLMF